MQTRGTLPAAYDGARKSVQRGVGGQFAGVKRDSQGPSTTGGAQHHKPIQGGYRVRKALARIKAGGCK